MGSDCISFLCLVSTCFLTLSSAKTLNPNPLFIGIAPQDEKLFASRMIRCKDQSKFFSRDRLNDGFCDCPDGTDEPGTSACPESKFYCKNVGSTPRLLFSSRVNDHVCDCCDGSDEYDGSIRCPNTCLGDVKVLESEEEYQLRGADLNNLSKPNNKHGVNLDDLLQKLKELKIIIMVEVVIVTCVISFLLSRRHARSRRRHFR